MLHIAPEVADLSKADRHMAEVHHHVKVVLLSVIPLCTSNVLAELILYNMLAAPESTKTSAGFPASLKCGWTITRGARRCWILHSLAAARH